MTTKTRFTSSRIVLLSLTASLFSMTAQADLLGGIPLTIPTNLDLKQNQMTTTPPPGLFETSLGNVGQAVDNFAPLGLYQPAGLIGQAVDGQTTHVLDYFRRMRDALSIDYVLDANGNRILLAAGSDIDILATLVESTNLPLNAGQAAGTLLHGVSDTVGSARGLLYNDPNNPYPISSTLNNLTGSLAATTDALLHGGNQLQPLLGAQTTALNNNAGLLAPVTNLVSSVTGGLGGDSANNQGLLAPITGLLGNGLLSPPAAATETPPGNTVAATNVGLLSPVTGLVNGLLGAPPR
ncbi:hypothetical protein [Alcaligenes phenolicus]|uniref:Uncharacterized protein n=1 Tax=Alcaligenes phenolicus TaxID=232846 RepID=A0AAW5VV96_9BURK|nr:hypothetical protein [Alcaligenes phenolicus]MCX5564210.1 hypothetical protein [Alcaligenes phenolicus]